MRQMANLKDKEFGRLKVVERIAGKPFFKGEDREYIEELIYFSEEVRLWEQDI